MPVRRNFLRMNISIFITPRKSGLSLHIIPRFESLVQVQIFQCRLALIQEKAFIFREK